MKIQIPEKCPCCDSTLVLVNDQLFCKNSACPAQLNKKLEHFCKTLSIKGLGPKTIEKLQINDLTELFYLDIADITLATGSQKTAEKLIQEIEKAKNVSFAVALASFSIPLIGSTASDKVASKVNSFEAITEEVCKEAGLGEKATANLISWLNTEYPEIKEFLPFTFKSQDKPVTNGKTVCITGKLKTYKNKSEAEILLKEAGYTVVDSVTKTLTYLVDEQDNNSSKRQKAETYGITIVDNINKLLG